MIAEFLSTYLYELLAVVLSALFGLLGMALKRMAAGFCTDQTKTALAKTAVLFVEQVFRDLHGADKLEKACAHLSNVRFDHFEGLLVDYMRASGAKVVLRGVRGSKDFDSECLMAQLNRQMDPEIETFFLATDPAYAHISSSAVREIGSFGGDITPFVPSAIAPEVARIMAANRE